MLAGNLQCLWRGSRFFFGGLSRISLEKEHFVEQMTKTAGEGHPGHWAQDLIVQPTGFPGPLSK
jgi:hypothetical protein